MERGGWGVWGGYYSEKLWGWTGFVELVKIRHVRFADILAFCI
jgi:hypothetical protein